MSMAVESTPISNSAVIEHSLRALQRIAGIAASITKYSAPPQAVLQ